MCRRGGRCPKEGKQPIMERKCLSGGRVSPFKKAELFLRETADSLPERIVW